MSMYSKNYLSWVAYEQAKAKRIGVEFKPLTGTQRLFAEFCLNNYKDISVIGNVEEVFEKVRWWVKTTDEFVDIEQTPIVEDIPIVTVGNEWEEWDWDDVEVEEKFDWTLPMKMIHEKYDPNYVPTKPTRRKTFIQSKPTAKEQAQFSLLEIEKDLYQPKEEGNFIWFGNGKLKRKCFSIGKITKSFHQKEDIGKQVYYDEFGDCYMITRSGGLITSFYTKTIQPYINYNGKKPNGFVSSVEPIKEKETLTEFVDRVSLTGEQIVKQALEAPSENFHYED